MNELSLIYPGYNEEKIIAENLLSTFDFLKSKNINFEILVVDNGSKDKTKEQVEKINEGRPEIRFVKLDEKGLGLAIRKGIDLARFDNAMFYAIDLPFGLDIITESLGGLDDSDIIIGSKGHKKSINNAPVKRKISSFIFNALLKVAFDLKVRDTQGSLIFRKDKLKKVLDLCVAHNAFFCTQLIIYASLSDLRITEIPVRYDSPRKGSKVSIIRDGSSFLRQVLDEYEKYKTVKKNDK